MRNHEEYDTGAHRDTRTGKGRFDLISPVLLERLARLMEYGANRYGAHNWEKGMPFSRCLDSALRHITRYMQGQPDEGHDDNLAAAVFNLMALMHYEDAISKQVLPATLDDLPCGQGPPRRQTGCNLPPQPVCDSKPSPAPRRIYVSGPFSADSAHERLVNLLVATAVGSALMARGHYVHVPHAATGWWHGQFPYEAFMALDESMIRHWATDVYAIAPSPGANREVQLAQRLGLPIWQDIREVPDPFGSDRPAGLLDHQRCIRLSRGLDGIHPEVFLAMYRACTGDKPSMALSTAFEQASECDPEHGPLAIGLFRQFSLADYGAECIHPKRDGVTANVTGPGGLRS